MKIPISMFCGPALAPGVLDALPPEAAGVAGELVSELAEAGAVLVELPLESLPALASRCLPPWCP